MNSACKVDLLSYNFLNYSGQLMFAKYSLQFKEIRQQYKKDLKIHFFKKNKLQTVLAEKAIYNFRNVILFGNTKIFPR